MTRPTNATAIGAVGFGDRLLAAVERAGNPVVVGLDPRTESLPPSLLAGSDRGYEAKAAAYTAFCRGVIDVVGPLVPAVKPQAAFFEELGPAGMNALAETIHYARQRGLLVILDGKRNDIGSTAAAYAAAYLGEGPWNADALTVSPYLGGDSLEPFVESCQQRGESEFARPANGEGSSASSIGRGIFVLVKTSNPGGGMFQDLVSDGIPLYRHVARYVQSLAQQTAGESGYGCVGAVVGATYPAQLAELREAMPNAWLLVPGYGSQGATARDVAAAFDARGRGAIINNSRGIIFAHAKKPYSERFGAARWQEAVEAATRDMIDELRAALPA